MTTIQITRPELEALIEQRLRSGPYANVEELILDALRSSAPRERTGADLIAAMKESPFREIDIEPLPGIPMPIRDVTL
jgi:Arc/MetJ-type ribon-helix-helix transcriptional regulator